MAVKEFVEANKFGLILRVSGSTRAIAKRRRGYCQRVVSEFPRAIFGAQLLTQANLVVWENPAYVGFSDIGTTYDRLERIEPSGFLLVPQRVTEGDLACTALNQAVASQRAAGITYSFIWSCEAFTYVHNKTLRRMLDEAQRGARAVGVILHEYGKLQRKLAWPMNTAALWDLNALQQVGDFDLRAQLSPEKYGSASTAEEVLPAIKLVKQWGRCIALVPAENGAGYIAPHPERQPDEAERHEVKISTKRSRFNQLAALENVEPTFLREQGLRQYPSTDV